MKYLNRLSTWIIPVTDLKVAVKCFSHLADTPKEVYKWVPLNLPELGDTIMFDIRTIEMMNGKDIEFLQAKKKAKQLLGVIIKDREDEQTPK